MTPTATNGPPSGVMRLAAAPADPRKKAHARLAERIDLVRNRHKPLSILRAEGKRTLEQFYDQEGTALTRSDRDRLIEDLLAESVGFGPLEELFRDEAVKEILIVNATTVLGRKGDGWLPVGGRFRDDEQLRAVLARWAEVGEAYVPGGGPNSGGFDVRLANGFRAVATLPPAVLEVAPQVWLARAAAAPATAPPPAPLVNGNAYSAGPASGVYRSLTPASPRGSGVITTPMPRGSGTLPAPAARLALSSVPAADNPDSGVISLDSLSAAPTYSGSHSGNLGRSPVSGGAGQASGAGLSVTATMPADPMAKVRQRVTGVIIGKFAAAGMYDLNALPIAELGRIILAQVAEIVAVERLGYDEATVRRLTAEIVASVKP